MQCDMMIFLSSSNISERGLVATTTHCAAQRQHPILQAAIKGHSNVSDRHDLESAYAQLCAGCRDQG